jgi:LacI family transcriptional regulator
MTGTPPRYGAVESESRGSMRNVSVDRANNSPHDGRPAQQPRRPSLRDVAERAGVALSTASRAMSGAANVRPRIRQRVFAAAEELGYEQNLLAQSLRRGSSMSIGFVVRDISNPMMADIVLGAERTLRTAGYELSLTNSEGVPDLDAEYIGYFRRRAVDGLLLSLSDESHAPTLAELANLTVPFVAVDRELPATLGGSAVLSDHAKGIQAAARHLASLGHRRIGLLAGPSNIRPGREVARGLEEFCETRPAISCVIEFGPYSTEFGENASTQMLTSSDPPTALVAGSYQVLLGILSAARAFELRIPEDVSVITFDDQDALPFFSPPIAAVSREPLELGNRAAELLLDQLAGRSPDLAVTLPSVLKPRGSCGPAPERSAIGATHELAS